MNATALVFDSKFLTREEPDGFRAISCGVYDGKNGEGQALFYDC